MPTTALHGGHDPVNTLLGGTSCQTAKLILIALRLGGRRTVIVCLSSLCGPSMHRWPRIHENDSIDCRWDTSVRATFWSTTSHAKLVIARTSSMQQCSVTDSALSSF